MNKGIKGIRLNVSYSEKEEAKKAGARWDSKEKTWYIPVDDSIKKVSKWLDSSTLIYNEQKNRALNNSKDNSHIKRFFIQVRSGYPCNKCDSPMNILAPFSKPPKNPNHTKSYEYDLIWDKPKSYVEFAKSLGVRMAFRATSIVKTPYTLHICPKCNAVQGDFYIFEDKDCMLPVVASYYVLCNAIDDSWEIDSNKTI